MRDRDTEIAIVGMGGIFPACRNLDAFWQLLLAQRTTARAIPAARSGRPLAHFYRPNLTALDKIISPYACLLDEALLATVDKRAAAAFGGDPLLTLTLAATQQALADTRSWPQRIDRRTVNVIIGHILLPTEYSSKLSAQFYFPEHYTRANIDPCNRFCSDLPARAICAHFNLKGDRYCLDAACASTLYALKFAMDDLHAERANTVICGGVLRADGLYPQMGFSQLQALSARGRCLPFSTAADGLVVGEGAGIFVLKRLSSALADGDRVHGILRAVGLSNDTRGNILAPDCEGQLRAMHAAYRQSGLSPDDIDYVECHATGAPRGDQVEIASLQQLFDDRARPTPCSLGAVKGNVGHLLPAAGAAGLAKILLALRAGIIPANIGATKPIPALKLNASYFVFNDKPRPWPRHNSRPRRAALNGFGFGGINAHLIVEEMQAESRHKVTAVRSARQPLAIIGMAAHCGTLTNAQQLYRHIFSTSPSSHYQPYIDAVYASRTRYRLPPTQIAEMLPQQLLMLNIADALATVVGGLPTTTGVYLGLGLDCNTGHFYVRWQHGDMVQWPALTYGRTLGALGSCCCSAVWRVSSLAAALLLPYRAIVVAVSKHSNLPAVPLHQDEISAALVRRGRFCYTSAAHLRQWG